MKKFLCFLFTWMLLCCMTVPAFAAAGSTEPIRPYSLSKEFSDLKVLPAAFILDDRHTVVGGSTHIHIESATWSPSSSLCMEFFPWDVPEDNAELQKKIYHTPALTGGSAYDKDFYVPQNLNGDYHVFLINLGPEIYGPVSGMIRYSISQ